MGRASSSKKVARAASTGGGRTARGSRPLAWYAAIVLVVVLGVAGIVFSRAERREELAAGSSLTAPAVGRDHWHAAYGVYLCDEFAPNINDERDPKGIHTHADGVIHIHPTVRSAAGENSKLGLYADAVRMTLTDSEIRLPGGKSFKEGEDKCGGKDAIVQVKVGDEVVTEDVRDIRFTDRQLLTIAFAPKGAELPEPPSKGQLDNLTDVPQQQPIPVPLEGDAPPAEGGGEAPAEGGEETPTSEPAADGGSGATTSTP